MAPLLVASPTKMNVLFRGVENPVDLSVPGVPADRVQATISSGRIVRRGDGWIATGVTGSQAEVFAIVQQPDGSTKRIGPVRFRVKDLPPPTAYIAGIIALSTKAPKAKLTASRGIAAAPIDALFEDPWVVKRFDLTVLRRGGDPILLSSTTNRFTPEMDRVLQALRPNDQVYVEGIRAQLANGQGPVQDLSPIAIQVLP